MRIKIPNNISKLKLKHVKAFEILSNNDVVSIKDKIKVISIVTGESVERLSQYEWGGLKDVFNKIIDCFNTYKQQALPLVITLEGKDYNLVQNLDKMPTGWFIDADVVNLEEEPELLASLCYIEKGMEYAEKDKHNNIINPLRSRGKVFKDNLPLDIFLDLSAFFLPKHKQYKNAYIQIQKARKTLSQKKGSLLNGRR